MRRNCTGTRLLNVEEKPFKRITKRLAALHTLASVRVVPGADAAARGPRRFFGTGRQGGGGPRPSSASSAKTSRSTLPPSRRPSCGCSSSSRANERERDRYAAARVNFDGTCQKVRDNTVALRLQLEQAKATLEQRKKFDDLADKITSNRLLRPRADQQANLQKLEEECRQLEEESEAYGETWRERRDQFCSHHGREHEAAPADQGREGGGRAARGHGRRGRRAEGADDSQTPRPGIASGHATPHPDSGKTAAGAATGAATPARESPGPDMDTLKPRPGALGSFSRNGSRAPSREPSPSRAGRQSQPDDDDDDGPEEGEDVEMQDSPRPPVDTADGGHAGGFNAAYYSRFARSFGR